MIAQQPLIVELWTARVPRAGGIAEHHWLEIRRLEMVDRWVLEFAQLYTAADAV